MKATSKLALTATGLSLALTALPTGLQAGMKEVAPPPLEQPVPEKSWELRATIPGWLASLEGETGVLGRTVDVDTGFDELIDEIDLTLALALDFRYERFLFATDFLYSEVSFSAEPTGFVANLFQNATVEVKQGIYEAYLGYRVVDTKTFAWDLFGGLRYNYYDMSLTLDGTELRDPRNGRELAITQDRTASVTKEWVDPLIATRFTFYFTPAISLIASGDIGGFGVSSDLTWQAYAGLRGDVSRNFYIEAGYRHQKSDYTDGGFTYDAALTGPQITLGLRF